MDVERFTVNRRRSLCRVKVPQRSLNFWETGEVVFLNGRTQMKSGKVGFVFDAGEFGGFRRIGISLGVRERAR